MVFLCHFQSLVFWKAFFFIMFNYAVFSASWLVWSLESGLPIMWSLLIATCWLRGPCRVGSYDHWFISVRFAYHVIITHSKMVGSEVPSELKPPWCFEVKISNNHVFYVYCARSHWQVLSCMYKRCPVRMCCTVLSCCHAWRHGSTRVPGHDFRRNVAHDGVCVQLVIDHPQDRGKWCGPSWRATWSFSHVLNHTLLGLSPAASQAGRCVGPALKPLAAWHDSCPPVACQFVIRWYSFGDLRYLAVTRGTGRVSDPHGFLLILEAGSGSEIALQSKFRS
jgi:hypothetical protein